MNECGNDILIDKLEKTKGLICLLFERRFWDDTIYEWDDFSQETRNLTEKTHFYYRKILEKINLCAVMLLLRTIEWSKGFFDSIEADNWLSAAASLRGAMESAGDARLSLKCCLSFLVEEKQRLEEYLSFDSGNVPHIFYDYSQMDGLLNDFIYANRLSDNKRRGEDDLPQAQSNIACVAALGEIDEDKGIEKYKLYYAQLCELTHPSGIPIRSMYSDENGRIKKNNRYYEYGIADLFLWASEMNQRIFINPIITSLCIMRLLAVMNVNPLNRIHKNLDLSSYFRNNVVLKKALEIFGKDNIEIAGK